METDDFSPAEVLEINDLDTLKVMADPLRMQIVDRLRRQAGTVKEIAAGMGVSPKSLYYHVNLLEKHGLVRVVETRIVSGILEKRYRATAYLFNFNELAAAADTPPQQRVLDGFSSILTITRDEVRIALESGDIDVDEQAPIPQRLSLDWALLDLTASEIEDLGERLQAIYREFADGAAHTPESRPYRLLFTMFPTYRRGERPQPPAFSGGAE